MSASQERQATLHSVAPRFLAGDMEQALAFYGQLGFAAPYHEEGFGIIERDGVALQFNISDPTEEPPEGRLVCWIGVTNIEALYQQYVLTGTTASPLQAGSRGMKEFSLGDPFGNTLLFGERVEEKGSTEQNRQPTLDMIAPRMLVADLEQALAFYAQLGFATTYRDGEFSIVERDEISLHFTVSIGHSVCLIGVTNIEALYQQYKPTGAIRSPHITSQPWGTKGFWLCDPFRNILIFEEDVPEDAGSSE
jgi:catechol 2,3-dioxygenase-like lactoylglutathione lyase family enzyme